MSNWISVKERLPTDNGKYLTTRKFFNYLVVQIRYFTNDLSNYGQYIELENKPGWYYNSSEWGRIPDDDIIAWQELPSPYRGR